MQHVRAAETGADGHSHRVGEPNSGATKSWLCSIFTDWSTIPPNWSNVCPDRPRREIRLYDALTYALDEHTRDPIDSGIRWTISADDMDHVTPFISFQNGSDVNVRFISIDNSDPSNINLTDRSIQFPTIFLRN